MTDAERELLVQALANALIASHVPLHLRAGLMRYFVDRILPGGFLQAVLCNDLEQTVSRAAPGAVATLPALVAFLMATAPADAWGSRDAVLAWTTTPDRLEI